MPKAIQAKRKDTQKAKAKVKQAIKKKSTKAQKKHQAAPIQKETFTLNNGCKMPKVGFGTSQVEGGAEFFRKVVMEYGYRHLDTASRYGNEEEVGEALQACFKAGIKREELFITTKLNFADKNDVVKGLRDSLKRLKLSYVDMYLIHWMRPEIDFKTMEIKSPPLHVVWKGMEKCVDLGLTKGIGVSNCTYPLLVDLIAGCRIKPAVN